MKFERIKFLVVALRNAVEIYAWAPKPYNRFMLYKSFQNLANRPLVVDLTVEDGTKLKSKFVIYFQFDTRLLSYETSKLIKLHFLRLSVSVG